MGEALITRRGGNSNGFEIIENAFKQDKWSTATATGLDFNRYDYLCHIVSEVSGAGLVYSDTYIIKDGIIVEEYHSAYRDDVYASITINISKGEIEAKAEYSNVGIHESGSLLMILK